MLAQVAWQSAKMAQVSLSFPQAPRCKVSTESTPVGSIVSQNYSYSATGLDLVANSSRLPSMVLAVRSADALYHDAADALLKEHNSATQTQWREVTQGGQPGAEMTFKVASGEHGKARFLLLDSTLYITQAVWTGPQPAAVDRFLDSLTIKNNGAGS